MQGLFGESDTPDAPQAGAVGLFAQVALEQGLEKPGGLTYRVPPELADLRVGDRVMVPLGRRDKPVAGVVLQLDQSAPYNPDRIKAIVARDRQSVNLPDDLVDLANWIARYYCCPLGMVFGSILPAAVKHGTGTVHRVFVDLAHPIAADSLTSIVEHHKLRGKQAEALGKAMELWVLGQLPIEPKRLADAAGARSISPVRQLVAKGLLKEIVKTQVQAAWTPPQSGGQAVNLNADQQQAVDAIGLSAGFGVHLLHGVTGSGKTEVYIRAIEPIVAAGKTAIVLVPEISLTPQTVGRFMHRFGKVAVLHSGLTAAQRHQQWALIREGWAQVVIGARSAVFAPVRNLGLLIVDEEHDGSYKQDQAPRYHARDVAVKRGQMVGAPVVLGSATPSLESWHNARQGRYQLLSMPRRVASWPLPPVELIDLMDERRKRYQMTGSKGSHLLSLRLEIALQQTLKEGGQAMLLLNRRGFASYIACPDAKCGWVKTCDHCSVNMVYHLEPDLPAQGLVRCHYCGLESILPSVCPVCGKRALHLGLGTQRLEAELARKFPDFIVLRMDSDSMRTAGDYEHTLATFRRGQASILVGTQMIAKGLDFPNVRLVGVISADLALSMPDFRAAERTFQLVCQVAGRSGRSKAGGRVIVQTFTPDHPAIQRASGHDFVGFADQELKARQEARLPPVTRMARIVRRDQTLLKAQEEAEKLAGVLRRTNDRLAIGAVIRGPCPSPIERIAGYYRVQIELTAAHAAAVQCLLAAVRQAGLLTSDFHTAVDVDPISLL